MAAASSIDFRKLREQTMDKGADEAVTVNTRALIDKVLARYSADWTTLRELIQNAADASASQVTIKYETIPSTSVPTPNPNPSPVADETSATSPAEPYKSVLLRHIVRHHTLGRLIVSNNGAAFGVNDWNRLRRIAEGNPDETKIGAFGVGFYSVFADCEEPFVVSGGESMAFFWKGNSLFTRSGSLPEGSKSNETSFILEFRNNTTPVPDLLSLSQFLATSLTFVGLERIDLLLDDHKVLSLAKITDPGRTLALPRGINTRTSDQLMTVQSVFQNTSQIKAQWMNIIGWKPKPDEKPASRVPNDTNPSNQLKSFFSKLTIGSSNSSSRKPPAAKSQKREVKDWSVDGQSVVFLRVSSVSIQTRISATSARELERATKKPPPKQTTISILASPHDATSVLGQEGSSDLDLATDIFSTVLPSKNGRIFIGFPTAQTTGMLCHVSAPSVIPTVERESIDLNARYVRDWNSGLLRAAGIAARIVYDNEMSELSDDLKRKLARENGRRVSDQDMETLVPAAVHVLNQHSARESTPSAVVGSILESAFWDCSKTPSMDILSNRGILPSSQVRVVSEDLSFLDNTPIVPSKLMNDAQGFVQKMFERGLLSSMTVDDIRRDLDTKALTQHQLAEFLKWAIHKVSKGLLSVESIQSLLEVVVSTIGDDDSNQLLQLSEVNFFQNISKIPRGVPVPPDTIPFEVTRTFSVADLERLGWSQLQIVPWLRHVCDLRKRTPGGPQDLTASSEFATQILQILSKQWDALSASSKTTVVELLRPLAVMPTKLGMRSPPESYFSNVKLFDDLPVIVGLGSVKEKFLKELGVRKTVELSVVFERLMTASAETEQSSESKWSHVDLVRYLVSVKADIPNKDIMRLRDTPICPVETNTSYSGNKTRLYKVSELLEPQQANRDLQMPTLQWPGEFRTRSAEGQFLVALGLRTHPTGQEVGEILRRAGTQKDEKLYESALTYFVTRYHVNGYSAADTRALRTLPILPCEDKPFPKLFAATAIFSNPRVATFGFPVLRADLQTHAEKFGVMRDPSIQGCLELLMQSPPQDSSEAKEKFGYLATRIVEIDNRMAERVGSSRIVPLRRGSEKNGLHTSSHSTPKMCFLGDPSTYGAIVPFVDFGQDANQFLLKVGSKHEPSSPELAWMIVNDPGQSLEALGQTRYLELLRKLSDSKDAVKADKTLWKSLRTSPCLLGYTEVPSNVNGTSPKTLDHGQVADDIYDEDDDAITREWSLKSPQELVVIDTVEDFFIFRRDLVAAPDEQTLENFYMSLGSPLLSSLVEVKQYVAPASSDQTEAQSLHKLIVERARLFVHDYASDAIRHDAKWIERNLTVQLTPSISIRKNLKGYRSTRSERRTAVLRSGKPPMLFVTPKYDLFEVSREIVHLLLKRPKQHDSLALDSILESKLSRLRSRGYNVDRILRRKDYESKLAEEQRKKIEEEQRARSGQSEEKSRGWSESPERGPAPSIPGAFEESPDNTLHAGFTNFFNNIRRQVGLGDENDVDQKPRAIEPPPEMGMGAPNHQTGPRPGGQSNPGLTSNYDNVLQDLQKAVASCRPHDSNSVQASIDTSVVQQAANSYCDDSQYQSLRDTGVRVSGLKFFVPTHRGDEPVANIAGSRPHQYFGSLVRSIASVFHIPETSMHIFDAAEGRTIAFNYGGAIFCNYNFFQKLHRNIVDGRADQTQMTTAWAFWFTTVAHELAHNLEKPHGPQHSFYTESFITEFMAKFLQTATRPIAL